MSSVRMPTLQAATDFAKEVVRPMLEASQTLAAETRRQGPPNYRRILFEDGYCVFSGGASGISLAVAPARSGSAPYQAWDPPYQVWDAPKAGTP